MKKLLYTTAAGLLMSFSMQTHAQITNNLQAYYPFGGNAQDQSGNGNNGQIIGNVTLTQDRSGATDCAYEFDGDTSSYIKILPSASFSHTNGAFSISLWYKIATAGQNLTCLFGENDDTVIAGNYKYWLGTYDLDRSTFYQACWEPANSVTIGTWNHLVGTYDNGEYSLYKNGVLVDNGTGDTLSNSSDTIIIGRSFKGAIDDVRFYNRKINTSEIGQLYALQSSCSTTSAPELQTAQVGLYPNPVQQQLTIVCPASVSKAVVSIYNILGLQVAHHEINGNASTVIDLSGNAAGSYIVKVQSGAKVLASQIVQKL